MKKIILLLILLPSFNVEAQDPTPCPHELIVSIPEEDSDFCNEDGACVFITVADVSNSGLNQVHLAIKNVGTQSTNYFPIDASNESVRIGYCYYPEGTVLEIFATDFETFCETSHFNYTVIGCSTVDNDNDGFTANLDCDDRDNTVYPGAPEICDGKDNDCDGLKDEDSIMETYYWDADLDGYGNSSLTKQDCRPTGRYVLLSGDCNDADPLINPGASEVCGDDIDNNCDGNIDEGCDCPDADSDTVCDADDICPGFDDLADADADGTPDCLDSCPNDANKNEPGDCGCGVADTDSDSDGTLDCNDACPNDPNKIVPGDCGCGVTDTDSDSDGTPDCLDNCPNDANKTEPGDCGCGIADTDTDSDGTPDCNDACPNDANKTEAGDCGCGIADTDNDSDGTPDCLDNCPNDANKTESGDCGCGVAETDSDSDGTLDCNDACPNDPNKIDPGDCGCGVAETDSDADGTPDCIDECPNDPSNTCNNCPDTDNDTVCDADDICPGANDLLDSDRDGTPDCLDNCPNDRNKTEPGLCGCGSSDADKDADGVPDCNDVCPRSPDTDSDFDGVPDCIDICDGENDTIDTDNDGLPDCVDTCPNDATNTCTANTCRAGYFEICHTMKNGNLTTLCVTPAQWERHKNHPGDVIGACIPVAVAKMATNNKTVYSEQLSIYPNPIKSNGLWIKFSSKAYTKKFTASLYDINGRKLAEKVFDSNNEKDDYFWEFDHGTWDKGVFIIEINDGNRTYYKRILKLNN